MESPSTNKISRRWPLVSASVAIVLGALLGLIIMFRVDNLPLPFDSEWMDEILDERSPWLEVPALVMNWLGGGWLGIYVIPVAIIIAFCVVRRYWAASYYAIAAILSVALVQLLKAIFSRPRPEDILVVSDVGSFPSGHVANAATIAVVIAIIFGRTWVWIAGVVYVILMALSRTYLGAHWVSDTIGGALLGAGVAVIVWAPLAHKLHLEQQHEPR